MGGTRGGGGEGLCWGETGIPSEGMQRIRISYHLFFLPENERRDKLKKKRRKRESIRRSNGRQLVGPRDRKKRPA